MITKMCLFTHVKITIKNCYIYLYITFRLIQNKNIDMDLDTEMDILCLWNNVPDFCMHVFII